jgi:16S rRNA (uracil1498-N3)-methyltransferase
MRDHRHFLFYSCKIEADRLILDEAETRHAALVLRLGRGDPFIATDGQGTVYECRVDAVTKKTVSGSILSRTTVARHQCFIHLLVGLPDRQAFEDLLVNLTALGAARITPFVAKHCQHAWWDRDWEKHAARLRTKMIAGMKQAQYAHLPRLDTPLRFKNACSIISGFCLVADQEGPAFSNVVDTLRHRHPPFFGVIGPPGGLAPEESLALKALGGMSVKIAPTRLTTELAAVVLCSQILGTRLIGAGPASSPGTAA